MVCILLENSTARSGIPELPGITRNYLELGGTGSSWGVFPVGKYPFPKYGIKWDL